MREASVVKRDTAFSVTGAMRSELGDAPARISIEGVSSCPLPEMHVGYGKRKTAGSLRSLPPPWCQAASPRESTPLRRPVAVDSPARGAWSVSCSIDSPSKGGVVKKSLNTRHQQPGLDNREHSPLEGESASEASWWGGVVGKSPGDSSALSRNARPRGGSCQEATLSASSTRRRFPRCRRQGALPPGGGVSERSELVGGVVGKSPGDSSALSRNPHSKEGVILANR